MLFLFCLQEIAFTRNLAIIFSTSIGWHNYRQSANAFSFYQKLLKLGMDDDDILLIDPEYSACTHKNPIPGRLKSVFCKDESAESQLDYRGNQISITKYYQILRGKYKRGTPRRQTLLWDQYDTLLIFHTGHGGNGYLKMGEGQVMQDWIMRFLQLKAKKILVLTDSCSAITLWQKLEPRISQNLISIASSSFDQKSLSHGFDKEYNSPLADQFTYHLIKYLQDEKNLDRTLVDLVNYQPLTKLTVRVGVVDHSRSLNKWKLRDFIGRPVDRKIYLKI